VSAVTTGTARTRSPHGRTMTPRRAGPDARDRYTTDRWPVWGGSAELVVAGGERELARARGLVDQVIDRVDRACSRFRDDSDLARVNAAAGEWVDVDPVLVSAVAAAARAAALTGGLVDPLLGSTLVRLGYDQDLAELELVPVTGSASATMVQPPRTPPATGLWRTIATAPGRVRIPRRTALDLGAIGKAWAVDAAAARLARAELAGVVSIAGDVAVVPGSEDRAGPGWRVDLREAPDGPLAQQLLLRWGAVATSTMTHRRWRRPPRLGGGIAHHIVDPRTGLPAADVWRTASVVAATAVDANTASTAAVVLGHEALGWLRSRGLAARLVAGTGRVATVGGWPETGGAG
jgi:thiamine biosynthesis lipoprotein